MSPGRHVRTRLYFTSESHVHSLLNVFRYGGLLDVSGCCVRVALETEGCRGSLHSGRCVCHQEEKDWQWRQAMDYLGAVTELNYMTQIVIMLYEDNEKVRTRAADPGRGPGLRPLSSLQPHLRDASRSPPQRSASTWSFTSVQGSKVVKTRTTPPWASASGPPPPRSERPTPVLGPVRSFCPSD